MSSISRIDESGLHQLRLLHGRCRHQGCTLVLIRPREAVLDRIQRAGIDAELGRGWIVGNLDSARRAIQRHCATHPG
jgi:anti-anti-sigma regulatory factor